MAQQGAGAGAKRGGLFISYRHEDGSGQAGRLYDRLSSRYGPKNVFRDIDVIRPGDDFAETIESHVGSVSALIAVIGPSWLNAANDDGTRRLDDSNDWVRMEIVAALERRVLVVPVLVGGARMPKAETLPEPLKPLASIQALELTDKSWSLEAAFLEEVITERTGLTVDKSSGGSDMSATRADGDPTMTAPELIEKLLDATGRIVVLDSFADLRTVSSARPVLLVTTRAEKSAMGSALNTFRKDVLPFIEPLALDKRVVLAFANVGGFFVKSDLTRYLVSQHLRYMGCHLVINGRFVDSRKAGYSARVDRCKAILAAFSPAIEP